MSGRLLVVAWLVACTWKQAVAPGDQVDTPDAATGNRDPDVDAAPAVEPDPTAGIEWFTWPAQQPTLAGAGWGTQLTDIARHLPAQYGDTYWFDDPITAGHETTHGIQAHLRNYETPASIGWNAFYVLGDKAAFVAEPAMRKSDIAPFIPLPLHGDRYATYITGQTEWDDTPLYIFDEWTAYTNGAEVGVGQVAAGLYTGEWTDAVMGPLEFSVYAIATAMAVQAKDPTYFASNLQFRRFTAWNIARAMARFGQGRTMSQFEWDKQDAYATTMRTDATAEAMRAFARTTWGPMWTMRTLGF
jgi:hypothetical protein